MDLLLVEEAREGIADGCGSYFSGVIVTHTPGSRDLAMSLLNFIETFPLPPGVSLKFNAELIQSPPSV